MDFEIVNAAGAGPLILTVWQDLSSVLSTDSDSGEISLKSQSALVLCGSKLMSAPQR